MRYGKRSLAHHVFYPDSQKTENVRCVNFVNDTNNESKVDLDGQKEEFLPSKVSLPICNENTISAQRDEMASDTIGVENEARYLSQTHIKLTYLNEYCKAS